MSSSAFFIDAAANTVRVLSCASADEWADPNRTVRATKNPAKRCMMALRACSRAISARKSRVGLTGMRQAEAPFCEVEERECAECREHADCESAEASRCSGGECVACGTSALAL